MPRRHMQGSTTTTVLQVSPESYICTEESCESYICTGES